MLGVIGEDLRDQRLAARLGDHEMNMRRPVRMAQLRAQQIADRAMRRHGIACRPHRAEMVAPARVGGEQAAQVHLRLLRVLVFIEPDRRGVPHIDVRAGHRPAVAGRAPRRDTNSGRPGVSDRARLSPNSQTGALRPPERSQQGRRGLAVVHRSCSAGRPGWRRRARRQTARPRCACRRCAWPMRGQEPQARLEFFLAGPHLADEGVQVWRTSAAITSRSRASGVLRHRGSTATRQL